ncbi:MAG: DMT family transporter [Pseudomonadota bacterium]|nr:DMT family transporter [Pseudomonadota bacterium]
MNPEIKQLQINSSLQGVFWMIIAGAAFASSNVAVRMAADDMHPFVILFFRSAIGVLLLSHILLGKNFNWYPRSQFNWHLLRGILQVTGLLCLYTAIAITPLATVIALAFITPLFTSIGGIVFMSEPSRLNRWIAVFLGLCGALIIIRPGLGSVSIGILLVIGYTIQQAALNLTAKKLTAYENVSNIVAWMTLLSTPIALLPALFVWSWPDLWGWFLLFINAACSTVAHLATTQAYRMADITIADPMIFFRLIAGAFLGYFFFAEIPDMWVWAGSAVIIVAATLLSRDNFKPNI